MSAERTASLRPNRTGAATRRKIVDAAIAVLAERGFSGFTLQAVADRAGVLFGSVTHHYGTRDRLIEAMLEAILEGYRSRFAELAAAVRADESPVRALVTFLIDDAVDPSTAGIFLELWAMATHSPTVAKAVNQLYDDAVDACTGALGFSPRARRARHLREALYVLGTVLEGTSAIFANRDRTRPPWRAVRREAIELLVPFLEQRLAEAGETALRPGGRRLADRNRRQRVSRSL
jgi:AcrR family transcriptional regulator